MDNKKNSGGTNVLTVLQIIFIVLKLLDLINWSWCAVFIPTFISIGLWVLLLIVLVVLELKS